MVRRASLLPAAVAAARPAAARLKTDSVVAIGAPQKNTGDLLPRRVCELTVGRVPVVVRGGRFRLLPG
ncbi:MAG TPA: hypothetical protein PLM09_00435 [Casimicrobiaceae bacterium]|nr:hypothetical protein [Casimicrobiaceae bacterium]